MTMPTTTTATTTATTAPAAEFDPYDGLCDPGNINHRHAVDYEEARAIAQALPPGWKRVPGAAASARPPYVHEPSGATSWKNPNFRAIMDVADAQRGKRADAAGKGADAAQRHVAKRLRLMLQAGAPLEAVERTARLEGIDDMALVLSPSSGEAHVVVAGSDEEEGGPDAATAAIPETLAKKYRRMIKAGVDMKAVQQLANREAGASKEQVAALVGGESGDEGAGERASASNPKMAKFLRMKKAGIPLVAIRNAARLQGYDADEVDKALGLGAQEQNVGDQKAGVKKGNSWTVVNKTEVAEAAAAAAAATGLNAKPMKREAVEWTSSAGGLHFSVQEGGTVSFPPAGTLTALVRQTVQTVRKTSQFGGAGTEMVVDAATLLDALGSLRGVQFALDEYNSALNAPGLAEEASHAKRHAYAEMAASIGAPPPADGGRAEVGGLDELIGHVEEVNCTELERGRALMQDGLYDFDSLPALYPVGSHVVAKHAGGGGIDCVCQVVWYRYTQGRTISGKPMKYFQLCSRFVAPVGGRHFTFAEVVEGIEMFEGRRSLSASANGAGLNFVPFPGSERGELLRRHESRGVLCNRLARADAQGAYLAYAPGSFFQKRGAGGFGASKPSTSLAAGGRVVVDFDAARDHGHSIGVGRDDMLHGIRLKLKEYALHLREKDARRGSDGGGGGNGAGKSAGEMILFRTIPDDYSSLAWPTTVGFSLSSKSWGDVVVDGLSDIAFDPTVFDRLVLPPSRKRMIKALVKHTGAGGFHDLVQGKGEGTCFLLHGQPGTGKTLTAEALAELLQCPLYSISMGTLGTTAGELERRLAEILELSARWNALVLLDEADSFLEARSSSSPLERNAMVSVMLRLVEYHRGILFLTSNRMESLDPAFRTRITLALRYKPLDAPGRAQVWENLLQSSGTVPYNLDVQALAVPALNGREIKNALRLAMALAAEEGRALSQELLLETANVVLGHDVDDDVKPRGWLSFWWG